MRPSQFLTFKVSNHSMSSYIEKSCTCSRLLNEQTRQHTLIFKMWWRALFDWSIQDAWLPEGLNAVLEGLLQRLGFPAQRLQLLGTEWRLIAHQDEPAIVFFFWNRTKFIKSQWPCHFKFTMHQTKWRFGGTTKTLVHTMTSLNFVNLLAVWDIRFQIHGADKILTNASFSIKST